MIHPKVQLRQDLINHLQNYYATQKDIHKLSLDGDGGETLEALFLSSKGINAKYLIELLLVAVEGNVDCRKNFFPDDPDYVNKEIQDSAGFQATIDFMRMEYVNLVEELTKSGTFFSPRTIGHMLWDTNVPGILGYFAALLYNQNNVAVEASPVTTYLEMLVGNELCKLLGYTINPIQVPPILGGPPPSTQNEVAGWGHITCDGSVANLEGLWMARNMKFYPISTKAAIMNEPALSAAKNFTVTLLNGQKATLVELDNWALLNLPIDEILNIPQQIETQTSSAITVEVFSTLVAGYLIQNIGLYDIMNEYVPDLKNAPVAMGPSTKHYSWPKGAAILGIGANNMWAVTTTIRARMDLVDLENKLIQCYKTKTPVYSVVAVMGTTEESAVDPLHDIVALRDKYRALGMEFTIHADAAWGGYFNTMLISSDQTNPSKFQKLSASEAGKLPMSNYVIKQYNSLQYADSITIDPHKAGYVPYPAGGLCYRNSAMRNLVSFTAPVVYHGGIDPTVGVYGVEGSKPGAAAAAVYFSHKIIRPNVDGYGKLLSECMFSAKRFYAAMSILNITPNLPFFFVPMVPIPAIQMGQSPAQVQAQYEFIRDRIVNVDNITLQEDAEAFALFKELGGDQTIITYMFNFYNADGTPNNDINKLNKLNNAAYLAYSFSPEKKNVEDTELVVTSSSFTQKDYGTAFMNNLRTRLQVEGDDETAINFLISTIMNPWLSNTVAGSFLPTIMEIMTRVISKLSLEQRNTQDNIY